MRQHILTLLFFLTVTGAVRDVYAALTAGHQATSILGHQTIQISAENIQGLWRGEASFDMAFPFPYKKYSYEIWQLNQPSLLVTQVIGEQNETFKYEIELNDDRLFVRSRGGRSEKVYKVQLLTSDKMQLCRVDEGKCQAFERIHEMPHLQTGFHETPTDIQIVWAWQVNDQPEVVRVMQLPLFESSYETTQIWGYDFSYLAPSGHQYHLVYMSFLLKQNPMLVSSYGLNLFMSAVKSGSSQSQLLTGTLSEPQFLNLNEDFVLSADHDKDHVQFRLRFERVSAWR